MDDEAGAADLQELIHNLRHGGPIPLMDLDSCSNGWSTPPGHYFQLRGPDYFTSRIKIPGGDCLLQPLAFDWLKSSSKIYEFLSHPSCRVSPALNSCSSSSSEAPFIWAFNLQLPGKDNYSAIFYFSSFDPVPAGSLVDRFLTGDDGFRNSRLKLIANVVKGPWIVKTAVGEQAICILGRALTCRYSRGEKFLEVDVDIGSSMVASAIVHLAIGYITGLTVDLAFLIESQQADELPEQILGAVRFGDLRLESAMPVEPMGAAQSEGVSVGARLWKGITTLLKAEQ